MKLYRRLDTHFGQIGARLILTSHFVVFACSFLIGITTFNKH